MAVLREFTKILLLSETYLGPIGDLSETHWRPIGDISETHRRPTFLIGDPSETDMPNRRLTCLIGDYHATAETNRRPTCLRSGMLVSNVSPMRLVGL